jgi:hypothetical protein
MMGSEEAVNPGSQHMITYIFDVPEKEGYGLLVSEMEPRTRGRGKDLFLWKLHPTAGS